MVNAAWLDSAGFNIRGWLLGINRAYVRDVSTASGVTNSGETFTTPATYSAGNYFGFELGYDKSPTVGGASWTGLQYNGNIAGTVWKSVHDSGQIRKYDFSYDAVNRLTGADFNQYTGTGFNKNAGVDFSVSNLSYDANGNILSMNQFGLPSIGANSSQLIDQLSYTYLSGTNKLQTVTDGANNYSSTLGDFKYNPGTKTGTDYTYDANGNLTSDANKNITGILYNYLNLPQVINVSGKGTISYTYDAAGNKLQKTTVDNTNGTTTVTTYIGGIVYQNDVLQFIAHEEGRIRVNNSNNGYIFDYYLKDHLGNTRMTITDDNTVSSPIIDATSYYPFGLTMSGISSKAAGSLENKYKYNKGSELQHQEFSDGSGLEWYDTHYRQLDVQLGRWNQPDFVKPNFAESPYAAMGDNPILHNDPLGDTLPPYKPVTKPDFSKIPTFTNTNGASSISGATVKNDEKNDGASITNTTKKEPLIGNTTTSKIPNPEINLVNTTLGDKVSLSSYKGVVSGNEGAITIDNSTSNAKIEGGSITLAPITLGYNTDFSLSGGIGAFGAEVHLSIGVGVGLGQISGGGSYTDNNKVINGGDITIRPGGGSVVAVAAAAAIYYCPPVAPVLFKLLSQ